MTDVAFLNDDNDILLAGHDNNTFGEVTNRSAIWKLFLLLDTHEPGTSPRMMLLERVMET